MTAMSDNSGRYIFDDDYIKENVSYTLGVSKEGI